MATAICPDCDSDVFIESDTEPGDVITCEECGSELDVLSVDPPEVRLYDGDELDDDLDDDDDLEDDEFADDEDDDDDDDDDFKYDDEEEEDKNY